MRISGGRSTAPASVHRGVAADVSPRVLAIEDLRWCPAALVLSAVTDLSCSGEDLRRPGLRVLTGAPLTPPPDIHRLPLPTLSLCRQ